MTEKMSYRLMNPLSMSWSLYSENFWMRFLVRCSKEPEDAALSREPSSFTYGLASALASVLKSRDLSLASESSSSAQLFSLKARSNFLTFLFLSSCFNLVL